ncbi:MAG: M23 family metallopeptidase [Bacteriovorax sp.]|nr:M23 family metallopeptidase [Rhizobacter sp.]
MRARQFVAAHPRSLTTAVMLALAGFAATAFGIAPLVPDASNMPKRLVTETVTPSGIQAQLDALAEHELQLYRTDLTRSSDTADSLLKRLNVVDAPAALFLRTDPTARKVLEGRSGKMVQVQTDESGAMTELVVRYAATDAEQLATHFTRLRITRIAGKLLATLETAPLASQVRMGSGTIRTSLFAATDDARIPDNVATQLAEVFATDLDFHRQLRKGDTFSVIYEALTADGEPITWGSAAGRVLAADFVNDGRAYSAVWFKSAQGKGAYYSFDGQNKKRAFLASPMEFSRVTSGFAMRLHPILNSWKQHKGVDYGAPSGTPVRAVGDGVVEFAGRQNGYGNVLEIRHSNQRSTLYAHLSRIDVRQGQHIEQGQRIGAVGATGWATGPHLHFEVKVNGTQQDPMLLARASETVPLGATALVEFAQLARSVKGQLEVADSVARTGAFAE